MAVHIPVTLSTTENTLSAVALIPTVWLCKTHRVHNQMVFVPPGAYEPPEGWRRSEGASNCVKTALATVFVKGCDHVWQALLWYGRPYVWHNSMYNPYRVMEAHQTLDDAVCSPTCAVECSFALSRTHRAAEGGERACNTYRRHSAECY